jgi:glutathione S-transferase
MAAPVVFGPAFSTFVRSVRIALIEKGVDYRLEEFNFLEGWPDGYERRHPFKKVPAFEHDGVSLYETCAINRYVDEAFDGPALQPATAAGRARMTQVSAIVDSYVYRPTIGTVVIQRAVVPMQGGTPDEAAIAAAVPAVRLGMGVLDDMLAPADFLAGDAFSLADAHLAPVMGYFSQMPEWQAMEGELANLSQWWQRVAARESVHSTTPSLG